MKAKVHGSLLAAVNAIKNNEVECLNSIFLADFYNRPCIYFLIDSEENPEVVYVGQSKSIGNRLGTHYKDQTKKFDSFAYIFVNIDLLDEMEEILISVFQPKYNEKSNNWLVRKIAGYMRAKNVYHVKKSYGLSPESLNLDKVVEILECDGNMGKWLVKQLNRKT